MNPEIDELIVKARQSLFAAEILSASGMHDFSASRSYYAMFYAAKSAVLTRGITVSKHSAVISAFGKEFAKTGVLVPELHRMLQSAQKSRITADYSTETCVTAEAARETMIAARFFLAEVERFLLREGMPIRLAVLISGGGRSLQNLVELIDAGKLNARVAVVISSLSKVAGVERAKAAGLPVEVVRRKDYADLGSFSDAIVNVLDRHGVQLAVQAGWTCMWHIPDHWYGRVMNIHPALLPKYGGKGYFGHHVHEAVLAAGEAESGCTVHFANNEYDAGPIVLQRVIPVLPDDTPDTLAARVFEQECIAYPVAIRLFAEGRLKIQGNHVEIVV